MNLFSKAQTTLKTIKKQKRQTHVKKHKCFYRKYQIYTTSPSNDVIQTEFIQGTAITCFEKNSSLENMKSKYFRGKHPEQTALETELQKRIEEIKKKEDEDWKKCKDAWSSSSLSKISTISSLDILKGRVNRLIKSRYYFDFPESSCKLTMQGEDFTFSRESDDSIARTIINVQNDLPALYQLLIIDEFFKDLQNLNVKVDTAKSKREYVEVSLDNGDRPRIDKNTLADFRLSLGALYYCDALATFDKGLAKLLKFLFPEQVHKIRLYTADDVHKTCECVPL